MKAKRKTVMLIVRRVLVVAAFAVAGICYVSGSENEDVYMRKSVDDADEEAGNQTKGDKDSENTDRDNTRNTGETTGQGYTDNNGGNLGKLGNTEDRYLNNGDRSQNAITGDLRAENGEGSQTDISGNLGAGNMTNGAHETREALTTENTRVNINTAGEEELTTLKGIGPAKARKIIEFRTGCGGFKSTEELMLVPGIKEATFSKIKDDITV
ncbi:MAG: helix-hairpin-helix domain-containing protein [Lachnospiraceae bacterium]|nr:helix-hairpin-helix domain-containing protein [Lachnospiraceae bacterium]